MGTAPDPGAGLVFASGPEKAYRDPVVTPRRILTLILAIGLAPLAVVAGLFLGHDPVKLRASRAHIHREADFVGAASCLPCHPDQHQSWRRTWHATMNQWPTEDAVVGAFDGREVEFYGQRARVFRDGEKFRMELPASGGSRRTAEVALVVGSHIYQQYFEYRDASKSELARLPLLWHIEEERWLHVNGIFLSPDESGWDRDGALWNHNCIFCHTTGPRPGVQNREYDSHVADLGISCEACHGPGRAHVEAMRNPSARYRGYLSSSGDTRIIHPEKLDKERAVSLCGQCHGQRLPNPPESIQQILVTGPTFRSGERLTDHVAPIGPHSFISKAGEFKERFWGDGTPRLTAYEYQGHVASPCYQNGPMTCESCHTMHGKGSAEDDFLREGMRGNGACLQCHEDIAKDVAAHTRHDAAGSGSQCMACHMPEIVYGVLGVHRSHRIENPDAARDFAAGRPHACTLCHLDRSPKWAGEQLARMFGAKYAVPKQRKNGAPIDLPDALVSVLSGDAVQRVVYAHALGRDDAAPGPLADGLVALLATLGDAYTSIRTMAWRSLRRRDARNPRGLSDRLRGFDPAAVTMQKRRELIVSIFGDLPRLLQARDLPAGARIHLLGADRRPEGKLLSRLLNLQSDHVISIGE